MFCDRCGAKLQGPVRHVLRSLWREAARSGELLSSLRETVRRRAAAAGCQPRRRPPAQRRRSMAGVCRLAADTGPVSELVLGLGASFHGRRALFRAWNRALRRSDLPGDRGARHYRRLGTFRAPLVGAHPGDRAGVHQPGASAVRHGYRRLHVVGAAARFVGSGVPADGAGVGEGIAPDPGGTPVAALIGGIGAATVRERCYSLGSARTFFSTGSRVAISTPMGAVFRSAKRRALTITRLSSDSTALL